MNVVVVGASGYSGIELIRILLQHPRVNITHLFVNSQDYKSILEIYPHLQDMINVPIEALSHLTEERLRRIKEEVDVVFLATPSGVSKELAPKFINNHLKIIDLSGDFRLKDTAEYKQWYQMEPGDPDILAKAVYGLPEWFTEEIKQAQFIANPGCYATSIILGLAPLYKHSFPVRNVIIDAKSGISGAGRGLSRKTHYAEVNENIKAYKLGNHQHIPEIEQTLRRIDKDANTIQMIPHLVPMTRGILSTIYVEFEEEVDEEKILATYQQSYHKQHFVRIRPDGTYPQTKDVFGTNYNDIGLFFDERTKRLIIISVIDNLMKGAAGQAVQNFNIMMGFEQTMGLSFIPLYP